MFNLCRPASSLKKKNASTKEIDCKRFLHTHLSSWFVLRRYYLWLWGRSALCRLTRSQQRQCRLISQQTFCHVWAQSEDRRECAVLGWSVWYSESTSSFYQIYFEKYEWWWRRSQCCRSRYTLIILNINSVPAWMYESLKCFVQHWDSSDVRS